ncbi:aquaporin-9-like isoform X2 [Neocloeon triangulifer]|uniref:aquaporin-9-like isoform X2 n=1 Tax=Neocloeon triangulifer TaxID=2078957 RepID=UPI00286F4F50|nr:aquaporin-9-like isoform X2 [Neocloeon triangulifer]
MGAPKNHCTSSLFSAWYSQEMQRVFSKCHTDRVWLREFLAEFIGTFILVFIGNNSVAQAVLSNQSHGQFITINFGYGFAVMMAVLVAGGASGGHLNPAVTLSLALVGKFPFAKIIHYMLAQYLGAFLAAACTYVVYIDALFNFDGGIRQIIGPQGTAGIFATYPQEFVSLEVGFADQVIGTAILLMVVCGITDPKNCGVSRGLIPLFVGLTVVTIGMSMGFNCGYALNPARDLSPRFFTAISGWTFDVFYIEQWCWVPILGPHLGGLLGALIYTLFIEAHWPDDGLPEVIEDDTKE